MARGGGGGKRRTYVRDASGRFASTPGGGLGAARKAARPTSGRKGTLQARSSLKASRAKLAAKDRADSTLQNTLSTRAQKGAVTRGNKALKSAKVSSREKLTVGRVAGTLGKRKGPNPISASPIKTRVSVKAPQSSAMKSTKGQKLETEKAVVALPQKTKTRAQKANQAARLAGLAASRSQTPSLSKEASLRNEKRSIRLRERSKQLSKEPKLSRLQKDIAARARKKFGVKSTKGQASLSSRGKARQAPALNPANLSVQFRSRKDAGKAYRQKTNQIGKLAASRRMLGDSALRVVAARTTVMQGTVFGSVKRVGAGPMKPIGDRIGDGSIRRNRKGKVEPIIGSKSWWKKVERQIKPGQADPWLESAYNRMRGKR